MERPGKTTTPLWRRRNVALLVGGQWVSSAGNAVSALALPWFVLATTGSRLDLGWLGAVQEAVGLLGFVSGVYVDRADRRRVMVGSDVVRAASFGLLGTLALVHRLDFPALLALVGMSQSAGMLFTPASFALVPEIVGADEIPGVMGFLNAGRTTFGLVGRAAAGVLLTALGAPELFLMNGVSFLVSVACLLGLSTPRREPPPAASAEKGWGAEIRAGLSLVTRDRFLRRIVVLGVLVNLFSVALSVLDAPWVKDVLKAGPGGYAAFWIAAGLGGVGGSLLTARMMARFDTVRIQVVGLGLAGAMVGAVGSVPHLIPDLVFMGVFGGAVAVQGVSINALLQLDFDMTGPKMAS